MSLNSNCIKSLFFFKLNDIYKFDLAKFMHKLFNDKLPRIFQSCFVKIVPVHSHETRSVKKCNYFLL